MNRATRLRAEQICAVLATAFLLSQGNPRAEVGVTLDAGKVRGPYLHAIVDDPTPFGTTWRRFSAAPSRVVLNEQGEANGDGNPDFVLNPISSLAIVAWARNNAGNFDVVVSAFSGGAWSTPQVVAGSSANELDPRLVVDAAGTVHLLYWVDTGTTQRVYYRHAPSDLSSWSAAILVSGLGEAACRPGAAIHGGVLRVAYEVHPAGYGTVPTQIVAAAYDGGGFNSEIVATSNNPAEVWPAVRSHASRLWVEWIDSACASECPGELGWMRWDPSLLQWGVKRTDPFATTGERDFSVRPGIRLEAVAP
jgi:hypothetical protein